MSPFHDYDEMPFHDADTNPTTAYELGRHDERVALAQDVAELKGRLMRVEMALQALEARVDLKQNVRTIPHRPNRG